MAQFRIDYYDASSTLQTVWLRKPYPKSISGNLSFNYTNLSFRSGHYASYIDDINDELISLSGFEDSVTALDKFVELNEVAYEGWEIIITDLGDAYNGTYVIENISFKPISLDVFEYSMTLKFVSE